MTSFNWPVRIYYEDTDSGGVVYYANYLRYMERARTEWLRHVGIEQDELRDRENLLFVVRRVELDYNRPAYFNDLLNVTVSLLKQGRASMTVEQAVMRQSGDVVCNGQVKIACVDAVTLRPHALPECLLLEIARDN